MFAECTIPYPTSKVSDLEDLTGKFCCINAVACMKTRIVPSGLESLDSEFATGTPFGVSDIALAKHHFVIASPNWAYEVMQQNSVSWKVLESVTCRSRLQRQTSNF